MSLRLAYLAPELGALTTTFVYREIASLRARGHTVVPLSTRRPEANGVSEEALALVGETTYLYQCSPLSIVISVVGCAARAPLSFAAGVATAVRDAVAAKVPKPTDRLKLLWHFALGCSAAHSLRASRVQHIHAHFAHVPTSIAMYAARLLGITFSFTAHANDIFERPTALREKVGRCAFLASISTFNRAFLEWAGCDVRRVRIIRCGLDVGEYAMRDEAPLVAEDLPPRALAVGRLVEKKGMRYLVDAVALLRDRGVRLNCGIVGDGPLFGALQEQVSRQGLRDSVTLLGALPQERVRELMLQAHVFVLPCVISATGDQDGIPVALMEAMALGVPVVSTRVSGIPELIESDVNGLLAPPGDAAALATAIERTLAEPDGTSRRVVEARRTVESEFAASLNTRRLEDAFAEAVSSVRAAGRI